MEEVSWRIKNVNYNIILCRRTFMETEDQEVIIFTSIVSQCYALMDSRDKKYISIEFEIVFDFF